ncbi:hypothetical protein LCGC14_0258870 [marine sediment metagenome]|uniref:Uncharacterized protein n=1 Tax=marine sediment metagenome TaxID=412755 RepID=A0A0F9UJA1_9ZZZZ
MAAYYQDVADAREIKLEMQVVVSGGRGQDCEFVFTDPADLIPELEQSWSGSKQARYAGRLRAVRQQMAQAQRRHQRRSG